MIKFKTTSPEMTEKFGYELAKSLCGGDVIALTGDLGAGKTCLTRGIAQGLGSSSYVSSPTHYDYALERKEARRIDIEPTEDATALRSEIEALKQQNEALLKQNAEMVKKNDALTERLAGFADALIKLADQQQQLTAQVNQHLMLTAQTEKPKRKFGLFGKK